MWTQDGSTHRYAHWWSIVCLLILGLVGLFPCRTWGATLTGVKLTTDKSSPQPKSAVITLLATPTGGTDVRYRFWQGKTVSGATTWSIIREYAPETTYAWTPPGPGSYIFEVAAREAATPDATPFESAVAFTITGVTIQLVPATATVNPGGTATFTATVTGATNTAVTWSVAEVNGGTITPAGVYAAPANAGTYHVVATSAADPATTATATVSVTASPPLTGVSLTSDLVSPQRANTTITFTATAAGGANVQYSYWLGKNVSGSTTWAKIRDYTAEKTYRWTPSTAGSYIMEVIAREGTSTTGLVNKAVSYTITTATAVFVTPGAVTIMAGNTTTFAATVTGASTTAVTWSVKSGGVGGAITPDGVYTAPALPGTDTVVAASVADPTVTATAVVTVTAPPPTPLAVVALNATPFLQQQVGGTVQLTASVGKGALNPQYWFRTGLCADDGSVQWSDLRAYNSTNNCSWTPTTLGVYLLEVRARETGSQQAYETSTSITFAVTANPPSYYPLWELKMALGPVLPQVNTPVLLLARPDAGTGIQYKFVVGYLTGRAWTWTTVQDYSANPVCLWTPTVARNYRLLVWGRDNAMDTNREIYDVRSLTVLGVGETLPARVKLATFKDNHAAAISYTFDDGTKNQFVRAVPIFDRHNMRATFNIIGDYTPDYAGDYDTVSWQEWRTVLPRGHEIGNHSLDHLMLTTCAETQLISQIEDNASLIAGKLGVAPISFALPHTAGNAHIYEVIHRTHVAVRGEYVNYGGAGFTAAQANALVDDAIANQQWLVPILHGVDDNNYLPISSTVLNDHLTYVQGQDAWVETFGTISRYGLERDNAKIAVIADAANQVNFTLTTPLDATLYNVPLTVMVGPLATLPVNAQAYRSGDAAPLPTRVTGSAGAYTILFDALPGPNPITVAWQATQ